MAKKIDLDEILNDVGLNLDEGQTTHWSDLYMIADETLNSLKSKIEEDGYFDTDMLYNIDTFEIFGLKLYEALNILLHDSTAIMGHTDEHFEYTDEIECDVRINRNTDLSEVITELENVDLQELKTNFDPILFSTKRLYPKLMWDEFTKEEWLEVLLKNFTDLLEFYRRAKDKNAHIIILLYGYGRIYGEEQLLENDEDEDYGE